MKCPIDESDLVMADRQGIEIDYCPKCRGVWLDRGELDKIIDRAAGSFAAEPAGPSKGQPAGAPGVFGSGQPQAGGHQGGFSPGGGPPAEAPSYPYGDQGGYPQSGYPQSGYPPSGYREDAYRGGRPQGHPGYRPDYDDDDDDRRRYDPRHRRKSFLGELFDFD